MHGADPDRHLELALAADLSRGLALEEPWLLAEHPTSAVNWQSVNRAVSDDEAVRTTLAHIARGADAAMFFQWRQSPAGVERFHSAMLPHAGTASRIWHRTVALGAALDRLAEVQGSIVASEVAILFDYEAWWACELPSGPSESVRYIAEVRAWHAALWRAGVTTDIRHPSDDLSAYRVIVVPVLTLADAALASRLADAATAGAHVVITYFSGIVDIAGHVVAGGYPGIFRELLGMRTDEFTPLLPGEHVTIDDGSRGCVWAERAVSVDAETIARFTDGPSAGFAAITRRAIGAGAAWYVSTRLDRHALEEFCRRILGEAGAEPPVPAAPGVEVTIRRGADADYVFALNHTTDAVTLAVAGDDLLTGAPHTADTPVTAGGVAVVRVVRPFEEDPHESEGNNP